jgi:AhpD family alkylhydroperoxidase
MRAESRSGESPDGARALLAMLGAKPDVLRTLTAFSRAVSAPGALSPRLQEIAALRTSILNGCRTCLRAHAATARRHGLTDEQLAGLHTPPGQPSTAFGLEEQAVLAFTDALTLAPQYLKQVGTEQLASHLGEHAVTELTLIVATANMLNRLTLAAPLMIDEGADGP